MSVHWDVSRFTGQTGYLAIIDGSNVWDEFIGVGHFSLKAIRLPDPSPAQVSERQAFASTVAGEYRVHQLEKSLKTLLLSKIPTRFSKSFKE